MIHPEYFQQDIFKILREHIKPGERLFLVGGAVRDLLLEETPDDVDFVIMGEAKKLSRVVADQINGAVYQLDEEHAAMRIISDSELFRGRIDVSELRGKSLEEDLCDRDFTINAMAIEVTCDEGCHIIDPCLGEKDLEEKMLRACRPDSIASDPVRILRGIRLALAFGFDIDNDTETQMRHPTLLPMVSAERKRDELFKILDPRLAADGFGMLIEYGLVPILFPGLAQERFHEAAGFMRNLSAMILAVSDADNTIAYHISIVQAAFLPFHSDLSAYLEKDIVEGRKRAVLLFFAVLHWLPTDEQKGQAGAVFTKARFNKFCEQLALSNREGLFLYRIIENRNRVHDLAYADAPLDGKMIYRFFRDTGDSGVGLCLCSLAETITRTSSGSPMDRLEQEVVICQQLIQHYFVENNKVIDPPALISGDDLITIFSLTPGPLFTSLLEMVREEQAAGNIVNRDQALLLIKEWLDETQFYPGDI